MRDLVWVGSSREDLKAFPVSVQQTMGYALYLAQCGEKHRDAKPLKGFGRAGVLEAVVDFDGDTYRTMYTVRLKDAVYVLHAFQKKSRQGSAMSRHEMELIVRRLQWAEEASNERL